MAFAMSSYDSPCSARRTGSATTSISRTSDACTSTRPTPGTRDSTGRIWNRAMSYSVAGDPPSRLYETMGKSDGESRSTCNSSPAGRSTRAWLTRCCVCCSAYAMSVLGANVIEISLAPRIDRECTRVTPGTTLTASSSGCVMEKTTWRAPSADPSATTIMRGNCSSG